MDPTERQPKESVLDNALDCLARVQELEDKLPRRSLIQFAVVGIATGLKQVVGELHANEKPRRGRAA